MSGEIDSQAIVEFRRRHPSELPNAKYLTQEELAVLLTEEKERMGIEGPPVSNFTISRWETESIEKISPVNRAALRRVMERLDSEAESRETEETTAS